MSLDVLPFVLPVSAGLWFVVAASPLARGKVRTPSDTAFVLGAFTVAWYALLDWVLLSLPDGPAALLVARLQATCLTLAVLFLVLLARWTTGRRRRTDAACLLPLGPALGLVWFLMVVGVAETPWGLRATYQPVAYLAWAALLLAGVVLGLHRFFQGLLAVGSLRERGAWRLLWLTVCVGMAAVAGLATTVPAVLQGAPTYPFFSAFLALPGAILLYVWSPLSARRVEGWLRGYLLARHRVVMAMLIQASGLLIESRRTPETSAVDEDIFASMLTAVQGFMVHAFPYVRQQRLRSIALGELTMLVEPGKHTSLVLVVEGEGDDLLRGLMRDALATFEARNAAVLPEWGGDPARIERAGCLDLFLAKGSPVDIGAFAVGALREERFFA